MGALHLMGVVLVPGAQGQRAQRRGIGKLQVGKVPVQDAALQPGAAMRQILLCGILPLIACIEYSSVSALLKMPSWTPTTHTLTVWMHDLSAQPGAALTNDPRYFTRAPLSSHISTGTSQAAAGYVWTTGRVKGSWLA